MIYGVENEQPFRVIPYDSVQRAMWRPIGDITGPWSSFSVRFGITFTENDGRYEAPGPVAYAAVELPTGEQFRLEHHFDHQEIGVVVFGLPDEDPTQQRQRFAAALGLTDHDFRRTLDKGQWHDPRASQDQGPGREISSDLGLRVWGG
jgi:hypothetical protein